MRRAQVLAVDTTNRKITAQLLGGPSVSALCLSLLPVVGSIVPVDEIGPGSWVCLGILSGGYTLPGVTSGGAPLSNQTTNPAAIFIDWLNAGQPVSIPNPGVPVNIWALVSGFVRDFGGACVGNLRVGIRYDGVSYDTGTTQDFALTGGGSNDNRKPVSVAHFVNAVTPVGDILIRPAILSNSITTVGENGKVLYAVTPAG